MKKPLSVAYFFLVVIGAFGVIATLGYDFFRPGEPDFGKKQFMGFVGSIMLLFTGLNKSSRTKNDFWNFISLFIYLAGIFYLVLMPHPYKTHGNKELLGFAGFIISDFSLNVIGFIPLGYLSMSMMSKRAAYYRQPLALLVILFFGVSLSFLIEIGQYYIPGRTSSLIDVAANGVGNCLGVLLYRIEKSVTEKDTS